MVDINNIKTFEPYQYTTKKMT